MKESVPYKKAVSTFGNRLKERIMAITNRKYPMAINLTNIFSERQTDYHGIRSNSAVEKSRCIPNLTEVPESYVILLSCTGSVPHSPLTQKKLLREIENKSPKKSLQRSQTFNSSPNLASPLPNKNLLKGPQMNVCCECKKMIMDIIRTSRTSIALINKGKTVQSTTTSNEEKRPSSLSASSLSLSVKNFFTQK
ncbi:unnamed protein product [Mytilus edulis]|uniref:Uncharacterized protein n=1 Tax=Mytilus edulis TaxID=6550 RepID=A0A8S3S242_MYTED|nr:unnamed protein product [Mytilus edulis]